MSCLAEPTVVAFVAGQVTGAALDVIDEHLADCRSCRDLVVWAAQTTLAIGSGKTEPEVEAPAANHAERYAITALLGTGGQGLVYAADDTVLGRSIALKVLRAEARGDQILAEARLVARLNHPNIVAIYDAGTTREGAIYLAMEQVSSGTLASWRAGRSQTEILRACVEAGRGLIAAHEAGIVHRDIKPSNVLIGSEGRARVTDFGLAREDDGSTHHGLAGTLAYMAPEQLDGRATTASDQFSFAVATWESLTDQLPFATATTIAARRRAIAEGPAPAQLPRHVELALRRAMAVEPAARYPSVAALVAVLAHDPRARRTRRWLVAGLGVAVISSIVFATAFVRARGPSCKVFTAELEGVWDAATRSRLASQFATLREPYAATAATTASHALDTYATAWLDAKTSACEAADLQAQRTECLDERKAALAAAVRTLTAPDAEVALHAGEIVGGLPALAPCADTAWLLQRVRPPSDPSTLARVAALGVTIAESGTALRAGRIKPAIAVARRALADSAAIDHAPTRARAAFALGQALAHLPDDVAAEAELEQAAQWAQRGRDDRVTAEALIELVKVIGHGLGRYDEALRQAAFADATLARLGDDPELRATLDYHRCAVYDQLARWPEATKSCAAALASRIAAFGANDASVADVLILQARLATNQTRYADAVELAKRALSIREHALGANHPALCETLFALGQVQVRLGKLDDATASYTRAMTLAVPTFGEDSAVVGSLWAERAVIASMRGDLQSALTAIDRSTAIRERLEGAMHVDLVFNYTMRGRILDDLGQAAPAVLALEHARELAEHTLGPDHRNVAAILQDLGRLHAKLGDRKQARGELDRAIAIAAKAHDRDAEATGEAALAEFLHGGKQPKEALPHYEHALAAFEAMVGPDSPQLIATLENLGLAHLDLHEPALALALLERAIAIERRTSGPNSPRLVTPLDSRGDAELALGHRDAAKATWKEALALPDVEKQFPEDAHDVKTKLSRL